MNIPSDLLAGESPTGGAARPRMDREEVRG